jgi:Leucine-rich repeat (LRR) protein
METRHDTTMKLPYAFSANNTTLWMFNNYLTSIPNDISCIAEVKHLYISRNKIESLAGIEKLTSLECVMVSQNKLTSLAPLLHLTNLTYLDADYNNIGSICNITIECPTSLKKIDMDGCHLHEVVPFEKFVNLSVLSLSGNMLTSTFGLGSLVNLTRLNISNNRITKIQLDGLVNLNALNVGRNKLESIQGAFETLTNLEYLHLHYNEITSIHHDLKPLSKLKLLDLTSNKIEIIDGLDKMTTLVNLDISYNPIKVINYLCLSDSLDFSRDLYIYRTKEKKKWCLDFKKKFEGYRLYNMVWNCYVNHYLIKPDHPFLQRRMEKAYCQMMADRVRLKEIYDK